MATSTFLNDIYVASTGSVDTYTCFLGTESSTSSVYRMGLSVSGAAPTVTGCSVLLNAGDGVARMHVDPGLARLYYYTRAGVAANGVVRGEHALLWVHSSSTGQTAASATVVARTASSADTCFDVFVSSGVVWVACENNGTSSRVRRVTSITATSSSSSDSNMEDMGGLSGGATGTTTVSVFEPSGAWTAAPSFGAAVWAVAILFASRGAGRV